MRPTTCALFLALASSNVLAGCGGCYDAFAVDVEVEGDEPAVECIEARSGPPSNSCGPTGGVVIDNHCDAPLVFDDPEVPAIPAGALGTVVSFDDADYDGDSEVFSLAGTVDADPLTISWSLD